MEMTELEKVIKGFKCCKRKDGNECKVCPYTESEYCVEDMVTDALAILKEQEAVVRCKDCKNLSSPANGVPFCKHIKKFVGADWFCADGVAKDKNVLNK